MEVILMLDIDESVNDEELADPQFDTDESLDIEPDVDEEVEGIEEDNQEVAEPNETTETTKVEKIKQTSDDNAKYAAARRESEKQMKDLKDRQENLAKAYGYSSFDELELATSAKDYIDKGYDEEFAIKMAKLDNLNKAAEEKLNSARISEEKATLKEKPYFKEYEKEVDEILTHNPNLPVELVFKLVKGENMDKILESKGKAIAQKTLNNINGKSHIKADGKGADIDTTTVDEAEWKFYQRLNPKAKKEDYAKFIKSEKRR